MKYSAITVAAFAALVAADEYNGLGNVFMSLSKDKAIRYGDVNPVDVMESIRQHCDEGTCETDSWTFDTQFLRNTNDVDSGTLTVTAVDSTYVASERDALTDALKILVGTEGIFSKTTTTLFVCEDPETTDQCDNVPFDQYVSSATFDIRVNGDGDNVKDHLRIGVTSKVNEDEFSQSICNTLATAGSSIAGVFSGGSLGAAGFALGGLACAAL